MKKFILFALLLVYVLPSFGKGADSILINVFKNLINQNPGIENFTFAINNFPEKEKDSVVISKGQGAPTIKGNFKNGSLVFNLKSDSANFASIKYTVIAISDTNLKFPITQNTDLVNNKILDLPRSDLDVVNLIPTEKSSPCEPCNQNSNRVEYNFSNNHLSNKVYDRTQSRSLNWFEKYFLGLSHPRVGHPLTFQVINVNPFRDSIIISYETMNYIDSSIFSTLLPLFTLKKGPGILEGNDEEIKKRCNTLLSDIYALRDQIEAVKKKLSEMKECENICKNINDITKAVDAFFSKKYPQYKSSVETLESFITKELLCLEKKEDRDEVVKALSDYYNFRTAKNYFFYKIPQLQNVDEYIFNLSIIPKEGMKSYSIVDNQPISVPLIGGFKVAASSGLFITKLTDHRFSLKPDSMVVRNSYGGDSIVFGRRNRIIQQNNGKLDFGVAALMHFYPRLTTWINPGISLGAGLSIGPNPTIRYLGGGSLIFGRNGILSLNIGCAAGFVERLDDAYSNQELTTVSDKSLLTKKIFKTDWYYSATFSLPLFKTKVNTAKAKAASAEQKPATDTGTKTEEKTDTTKQETKTKS